MIAHNIQAGNTRPFEGTSGTDVSSLECGQWQIGIVSAADSRRVLQPRQHPNFGPPNNGLTDALIGQSTQAVASSLGFGGANGGFNNLYQIGGAHSIQLRLNFSSRYEAARFPGQKHDPTAEAGLGKGAAPS
jgi:hypothetical protein